MPVTGHSTTAHLHPEAAMTFANRPTVDSLHIRCQSRPSDQGDHGTG